MSNILVRTITGAVFITVLLTTFYLGSAYTTFLFGIIITLALTEFYNLFKSDTNVKPLFLAGIIGGVLIYLFSISNYFLAFNLNFQIPQIVFNLKFLIILLVFLFIFIVELYRKTSQPMLNIALTLSGWLYIIAPFYFIALIAYLPKGSLLITGLFLLVWTNDTFAYLTGSFIGKTKLFERISPKKTWEGTIGGVIFAVLVGYLFSFFLEIEPTFWMVAAFIIALAAILGDLFQSMIKRSVNVKDSGSILPGHGGMLDRFDAVIFAGPCFYVFLHLWH